MSTECTSCRFAELDIVGEFLNEGRYTCARDCDMAQDICRSFEIDPFYEDFEYRYAS